MVCTVSGCVHELLSPKPSLPLPEAGNHAVGAISAVTDPPSKSRLFFQSQPEASRKTKFNVCTNTKYEHIKINMSTWLQGCIPAGDPKHSQHLECPQSTGRQQSRLERRACLQIFQFEATSNKLASLKLKYWQTNLMPRVRGCFVLAAKCRGLRVTQRCVRSHIFFSYSSCIQL